MPTISTGSTFDWSAHNPVTRIRMHDQWWNTWNYGSYTTTTNSTYISSELHYTTEWVERTWSNMYDAWEYKVTDQATGRTNTLVTGHPDVDPQSVPGPNQLVTCGDEWREPRNGHPHYGMTQEEIAARQAEAAELSRAYRERQIAEQQRRDREREAQLQQRETAQERSLELLKLVLTPEEYEIYDVAGVIEITGSAGGKYRIVQSGYEGNVEQLDADGEVTMRVCAHPRNPGRNLPSGDMWVGQVLALKTDEEEFLAMANVHWSREPVRPRPRRTNQFLAA